VLLTGKRYALTLFRSAAEAAFETTHADSVFQTAAYHLALEEAPPADMAFYYVRIDCPDGFAGLLSFQVKRFNPGESLRNQAVRSTWNRIRYSLARLIDMEVLCLGNTLVTGDYGMLFAPRVPKVDRTRLMTATMDWLLTLRPFRRVRMLFVKDFYEDIFSVLPAAPAGTRYHPIATQPNMILDIDPAWGSLDGYLAALKSKYRVRAKKALSLARGLECKELDLGQIIGMKDVLHGLYRQVAGDVGFNLFTLSPDYMPSLKRRLGDRFRLWVYKEDDQVISFFTVIEDGEWLDAHFLGYDPGVNKRYHLYHHMLLTMIDLAARRGFRKLQLSRTATEIKSSVGAAGVPMWAYMRHTRPWVNVLFPHIYRFFQPDLSWVPRSPFNVDRADPEDAQ
jgi:hypothetical protein